MRMISIVGLSAICVLSVILLSSLSVVAQATIQNQPHLPLVGETTSTGAIEWLPDQDIIVTTDQSRLIASQPDGEEIATITISSGNAVATDLESISDELLAVGTSDGEVCFVAIESWQILNCVLVSGDGIKRITISNDAILLGVIDGNNLYVYTMDDEQTELTLAFHTEISYLLDFVFFNDRVGFSGGWDGVIRIWDSVGEEEYGSLRIDQESPINNLDISFEHNILASAHTHGVSLWDITTREKIIDLDSDEFSPRWSIAFNRSETQLAVGSALGTVEIWNIASYELIASWNSVDSGITDIAYSSDGRFLAVRYENDLVQIWDTEPSI